jgi:hypothetical protein
MTKIIQHPDQIINSALNNYRVDVFKGGSWCRRFIAAPNMKTARTMAKTIKSEFLANRADKKGYKTEVKRWEK